MAKVTSQRWRTVRGTVTAVTPTRDASRTRTLVPRGVTYLRTLLLSTTMAPQQAASKKATPTQITNVVEIAPPCDGLRPVAAATHAISFVVCAPVRARPRPRYTTALE